MYIYIYIDLYYYIRIYIYLCINIYIYISKNLELSIKVISRMHRLLRFLTYLGYIEYNTIYLVCDNLYLRKFTFLLNLILSLTIKDWPNCSSSIEHTQLFIFLS